jgi:hypothetical protein
VIVAAVGAGLTGVVAALLVLAFGRGALLPALAFGALATLIQAVADRLLARRLGAPAADFGRGYVAGTALRLGGIVAMTLAVVAAPALFPPLPTALGFLGVLVPLLFMEMRLAR